VSRFKKEFDISFETSFFFATHFEACGFNGESPDRFWFDASGKKETMIAVLVEITDAVPGSTGKCYSELSVWTVDLGYSEINRIEFFHPRVPYLSRRLSCR
jgi:hypothetical protein